MKDYIAIIIGAVVTIAIFTLLWRQGYLLRFSNYIQETNEELKKCSWPTSTELKGSTVVVAISIILLGTFTVAVDLVIALFVRLIT